MKICSCCKVEKFCTEFGIQNRRGRTEFLSQCKKCRDIYRNAHNRKRRKFDVTFKEKSYKASSDWAKKNPEKVSAIQKRHKQKPETKARRAEYVRLRSKTDINFRLRRRLSSRIVSALRFHKASKSGNLWKLLGCSLLELRLHLEKQFQLGMAWENYGPGWHIDHIKPCAKFDLSDPSQQRECFHYTNLQPLWAIDNLRKGDKSPV